MLYLKKDLLKMMLKQIRKEAPDEACGILAGKDGRVEKIYKMSNPDKSSETFFMDPKEQIKVMKKIRKNGLEMVGIYHSHTKTDAYPSQRDVEFAFYPEVSYVIISLKNKDNPYIRSFKIENNKIKEEEIKFYE